MSNELARAADPLRKDWRQASEHMILAHHQHMEATRPGVAGSRARLERARPWSRELALAGYCDHSKHWAKLYYDSTLHSRGDRESREPRV